MGRTVTAMVGMTMATRMAAAAPRPGHSSWPLNCSTRTTSTARIRTATPTRRTATITTRTAATPTDARERGERVQPAPAHLAGLPGPAGGRLLLFRRAGGGG